MHLVLQDELLRLGDGGVRLALLVFDDELDVGAAELVVLFVEIHLEAVDHVLADLGEDTGGRREIADPYFFGLRGCRDAERHGAAQQQRTEPS